MTNAVACSECFLDEGLKLSAQRNGVINEIECINCKKRKGAKLNIYELDNLCRRFFVYGSYHSTEYGGAPLIQYNEYQKTSIDVSPNLHKDIEIFERELKIGFFYYGPRLYSLGHIEPLINLQNEELKINELKKIIELYPIQIINTDTILYRLRKNPSKPSECTEYDSAPIEYSGAGRFDLDGIGLLYASNEIEICIHECRVTLSDELYIATLKPTRELKLLDLTQSIKEEGTEFESLFLSLLYIFNAENNSYQICRDISNYVQKNGYDGLIYPSYFNKVRELNSSNFALFGHPLKESKIEVSNINRLMLNKVLYDFDFGPVIF